MSRVVKDVEPNLETLTYEHKFPAPKEIKVDEVGLNRVARPLRHVKHIPVKSLMFQSKEGPMEFSYEQKIKGPIPKDKLVIQVQFVGLNPVDLKIKNGYKQGGFYGEIGLGREYFGVVTHVGEDYLEQFKEGDEVMGIFYHPHSGRGCLQSAIIVDPKIDPISLKPQTITMQEAASSLFCLGVAYKILEGLNSKGLLKPDTNVLINGGTTSIGMFVIQLLKNHYHLVRKIVVVTTSTGSKVIKNRFPELSKDLIFINYLTCRGKASKPLKEMMDEGKYVDYDVDTDAQTPMEYNQGKFDVVLDFIGGYDILSHSQTLIHAGGQYITTVGDYVGNYKEDIFESWGNPSANARIMFGNIFWAYTYTHFWYDPNSDPSWVKSCVELLEKRVVKCVVSKTFDWKQHKEAFNLMKTQRAQGKIVLKVEKF